MGKTIVTENNDELIINGSKMWITNGVIDNKNQPCDVLYLYAKLKKTNKISTILVESQSPGFKVGQIIKNKLGMRGSPTAEMLFDNCKVPKNNIVSDTHTLKNMMRNLQIERLALASISIGIAKHMLNIMIQYSKERRAFNKFINQFGQIQQYIANSYAEY